MALRTQVENVKGILLDNYRDNASLSPFIRTASVMTDRVVACDTESTLSTDDLREIETWLAAHFYAHGEQLLQESKAGRAGGKFQGKTAMHLDSTQYGQTAMMMDHTGCLSRLNQEAKTGKKSKVNVVWLGTDPDA